MILTTIKTTGLDTYAILNSSNDLIATASEIKKTDTDFKNGKFRICIYGGIAHGKFAYANSFEDLNEKSVEIAELRNVV